MTSGHVDGQFTIGRHHIYLSCSGALGPTVIFEAAVGEDHKNWLPIAERIRPHALACVYDRVGVGKSSKPEPPMSAADHADHLHLLLEAAGLPRPVVLVAHSYGGFVALLAATTHPDDVAGLVLVDASHPRQEEELARVIGRPMRDIYPAEYAEMAKLVDWEASQAAVANVYGRLPPVPLTVISATRSARYEEDPPDFPYDAFEAAWSDLQAEHARLRPDARHVLTPTTHYVHGDDPDLVVTEVLRMVDRVGGGEGSVAET